MLPVETLELALAPLLIEQEFPVAPLSPLMPEGLDSSVYTAAFLARFPDRAWSWPFAELRITAGRDGPLSLRVADAIQNPGEVWLVDGGMYFLASDGDDGAQARFIRSDAGPWVRARALPEAPRAFLQANGVLIYTRM
jgi:hypothetical protein